jgi:hypothetical protein
MANTAVIVAVVAASIRGAGGVGIVMETVGSGVVGSAASFHPEIKWQAHSYNDMRAWPALFRKGTQFLKIDINWQRG